MAAEPAAPDGSLTSEDFWALNDVSFDIQPGQVVGVIGRNGAGKSTLLKILSRITEPTRGRIRLRGRIASLLEVGTGFHPELTGRENIFLNGAILGMSRLEIHAKLDEIVAFAEVERFLDTPVKRYSSGMYVRLAFGVAAHLEPDILVLDEVLAVGDTAFQNKCLGKIGEISRGFGRTVLLVSHNIGAVQQLCTSAMYLANGRLVSMGETKSVIAKYMQNQHVAGKGNQGASSAQGVVVEEISIGTGKNRSIAEIRKPNPINFSVKYKTNHDINGLRIGYALRNITGTNINGSANAPVDSTIVVRKGVYAVECSLPTEALLPGEYYISLAFDSPPYTAQILRFPDVLFVHLYDDTKTAEVGLLQLNPKWAISSIPSTG